MGTVGGAEYAIRSHFPGDANEHNSSRATMDGQHMMDFFEDLPPEDQIECIDVPILEEKFMPQREPTERDKLYSSLKARFAEYTKDKQARPGSTRKNAKKLKISKKSRSDRCCCLSDAYKRQRTRAKITQ